MKKLILFIFYFILSKHSLPQVIKSFECNKIVNGNTSTTDYSIKVIFNVNTSDSIRINLIKSELKKRFFIESNMIVYIQSCYGKRFRSFLYTVKVENN